MTQRTVEVVPTKWHPRCPKCSSDMHLMRKIVSDTHSVYKEKFHEWWGCTQFPRCKSYLSVVDARKKNSKFLSKERKKKKREANQEERKRASENTRVVFSRTSRINYYQYINSPEWKLKADEAKKRARYRCQVCNKSSWETILHTHHRTYERLGFEMEEDLVVLCEECHSVFHKNGKIASYKKK